MKNENVKYLFSGLIIGSIVGVVLSAFRLLLYKSQDIMKLVYGFGRQSIVNGILIICFLAILGLIVGYLTQKEPKIGGSGIPQVSGQIKGIMKVNWKRVLPFKFIGGLIGLGSGLTIGREGPSVQMGASIGQAYGDVAGFNEEDTKLFISAGAAAGLSVAFNAPISGLVLVLEELQARFNKFIFISALGAALAADYIGGLITGVDPVLATGNLEILPARYYIFLIGLGVFIGVLAPLFIKGIYYTKKMYDKLPIPKYLQIVIPFVITGIVVLIFPSMFGSGEPFIFFPMNDNIYMTEGILLLITKFILLLLAFSSGMPGGIFLPMLVLGSLLGNIFGQVLASINEIHSQYILIYSVFGMCANFAAIVRSPLTAIILLLELTGSFTFFLPIGVIVLTSYVVIEILNVEPVYEMLLEDMLEKDSSSK